MARNRVYRMTVTGTLVLDYYYVEDDHTIDPEDEEMISMLGDDEHRSYDKGLSEETIVENLKTTSVIKVVDDDEGDDEVCVVCQDDLYCDQENETKIGRLDCGHEFHAGCIKKWLTRKNECPVCRATGLEINVD